MSVGPCGAGGPQTESLGSDRAFWAAVAENERGERAAREAIAIRCAIAKDRA